MVWLEIWLWNNSALLLWNSDRTYQSNHDCTLACSFYCSRGSKKSPDFWREIRRFWAIPPKLGENLENRSCWEAWFPQLTDFPPQFLQVWAVAVCQLVLEPTPEVFDGVEVRAVPRPVQHSPLLGCQPSLDTGHLVTWDAVLEKYLGASANHGGTQLLLQNVQVSPLVHHLALRKKGESATTLPEETSPNHCLWGCLTVNFASKQFVPLARWSWVKQLLVKISKLDSSENITLLQIPKCAMLDSIVGAIIWKKL